MSNGDRGISAEDPYAVLAPFYDLGSDEFDADIDLYEAFARRNTAPVLELGVGTGRVARALARRGLTIVGVDRSRAMLAIARRRIAEEQVTGVELHHGELQRLTVPGHFGLILCPIDGFLHLLTQDEQIQTLQAARERLAPGGLVVLDLPGPAGEWGDWEPGAHPLVLDWTAPFEDGSVSRFSTFRSDAAAQLRHITEIYDQVHADGTLQRHIVEYALRFVFPAEAVLLLRLAGLRLRARYGDYDLSPFAPGSQRMIVVAEQGRAEAASGESREIM